MKAFKIVALIILILVGAYFTWAYIRGSEERELKNELESYGVNTSSVWTGKLTSGHNFINVYVEKLDAASIQRVLSYVNSKPDLADASLEVKQILEGSRYSGKAFEYVGVVGRADYTKDTESFLMLLEGYRDSLDSAAYYTEGFFASAVVDENGERFQGGRDMKFEFPDEAPRATVTQFMQTLWTVGDAHQYTTVWYGSDAFSASTIDGNQNNRILRPSELEAYKQDILQQISAH